MGDDAFSRLRPVGRDRATSQEIPDILDYLEPIAPNAGFMFGEALSIADTSIAAFFRNAAFARYSVDARRWPKVAAYIARVFDAGPFVRLRAFEDLSCRTPIDAHREALRQAGAPIMAESLGTTKPRRGFLRCATRGSGCAPHDEQRPYGRLGQSGRADVGAGGAVRREKSDRRQRHDDCPECRQSRRR
jgi:hypothetical protein